MPPDPLNGLELTVELNLGLEKSGKSQGISYCLESGHPVQILGRWSSDPYKLYIVGPPNGILQPFGRDSFVSSQ